MADEVEAAVDRLRADDYPDTIDGEWQQQDDWRTVADAYIALGDLVCQGQEPTIDDGKRWIRSVFMKGVDS